MDNQKINQLVAEKIMGLQPQDAPNYSESISTAWQVVERLKKDYIVEIIVEDDFVECRLQIEDNDNPELLYTALAVEAETVPIAICLAALKSKGVEL